MIKYTTTIWESVHTEKADRIRVCNFSFIQIWKNFVASLCTCDDGDGDGGDDGDDGDDDDVVVDASH